MRSRFPTTCLITGIFAFCCFVSASSGQVPTPTPRISEETGIIRVDTELIDVPVAVADRAGKPIFNLKRSNFRVFEDGRPQEIVDFSSTTAPFEVALLLDTSGSTRADITLIKNAARAFIDSLRPGDKLALVAFGPDTEGGGQSAAHIVESMTGDRNRLRAALDRVTVSNGTPYYDGLVRIGSGVFGTARTAGAVARRAVVALTDGVDSTSSAEFDEAKETLGAEGIVIYFIRVDTRDFFESELLGDCESAIRFSRAQIRRYYRAIGAKNIERATDFCQLGDFERLAASKALYELADLQMADLASSSGGKVFPVAELADARNAFKMVAAEIGTNYSLGYYSSNEKRDGKYRSIRVELKGLPPGSTVRARQGYTSPAH